MDAKVALRIATVVVVLTAAGAAQAAQWAREEVSVAPGTLNGVAAIDGEHAWAVGDGGLVLKRDQGSWQEVIIAIITQSEWDFRAVEFANQTRGWIVGEKNTEPGRHIGIILTTMDAGQNWQDAYPLQPPQHPPTPFYDVHFLDASVGWVAGGDGYVLSTRDAGQHWDVHSLGTFCDHSQGVWAENELRAWACGDNSGTVAKTEDGGANWDARKPFDKQYIFPDLGLRDCKRANAALWASHFDTVFVALSEGKVGRTTDGGAHWEVLSVRGTGTWFRDVWSNHKKVWAIGTSGVIMCSADAGDNWREEHGFSPYHLNSIELVPGFGGLCSGWAVGTVDPTDNSVTILRRVPWHDPLFSCATSPEPLSVELSWEIDPGQPVQHFELHRSFNNSYGKPFDFEVIQPFSPGVGSYGYTDHHDYAAQWSYYYWLDAFYEDGSSESFGPYRVPGFGSSIPSFPPAPQELQAEGTPNSILLTWDDVGPYTYHIYRSEVESGPYQHIGETQEPFYEDNTALQGITYFYTVKSEMAQIASDNSPVAAAGSGGVPPFEEIVQPDSTGIYYDVKNRIGYFGWLPVDNFDLGGYWVSLNDWEDSRILNSQASLQRLWYGYKHPERLPTGTMLRYGVLAMHRLGVMGSEWQDRRLPIGACNAVTNEATLGNNACRFVKRENRLDVLFADCPNTTYRIYHTFSTDGGQFWSEPSVIGDGKFPALASKGEKLYAVWTDLSGRNLYFSRYEQGKWIGPIPLIEAGPAMTPPSFVVDDLSNCGWGHVVMESDAGKQTYEVVYGIILHPDDQHPAIDKTIIIDSYKWKNAPSGPPTASIAYTQFKGSLAIGVAYAAEKDCPPHPTQWDIYLWALWSGNPWQGRISRDDRVFDSRSPSVDVSCGSAQIAWEQQDPDRSNEYRVECRRLPFPSLNGLPDASLEDWVILDGKGPGNNAQHPRVMGNSASWMREMDDPNPRVYWEICYSVFEYLASFTYRDGESFSDLDWGPSMHPQVHLQPSPLQGVLHGIWSEGYDPHAWVAYETVLLPYPVPEYIYKMGGEELSPITVERDGYIWYGEESYKKVDYSTTSLQYCITDLDPTKTYSIGVGYYQDSGEEWKERAIVNDDTSAVTIPSASLVYQTAAAGKGAAGAGDTIHISIERLDGDTAICSYITLFEGEDGGGAQSATRTSLPGALILQQNFPNPFATSTRISYSLQRSGGAEEQRPEPYGSGQRRGGGESRIPHHTSHITLRIYDLAGRLVRTLVDQPSNHPTIQLSNHVVWDGTDDSDNTVPTGVYFYRLQAGQYSRTKKLILLR